MVSRLTYDGLRGHAGEGFGRIDHTSGFYRQGLSRRAACSTKGDLIDEDFEPFIAPYSSTLSEHPDGHLAYGSDRCRLQSRAPTKGLRLGAFAGYHYFSE